MTLEAGAQLNQYSIREKIGEGGMGAVYSADDTRLGRRVALKVLAEEFAADRERFERFEREARAVAALNHPNVITLYSVDQCNGTHFLTMEWIDGRSLADLIPEHGFGRERFFELALPITEAIAAAHSQGIIHRDLKPSNVMIGVNGRVKVLDFGLAKALDCGKGPALAAQPPTDALTVAGTIVGTVTYMSPEQAQGLEVDERSDVFSLGVMLYEMLTGRPPFSGATTVSVISAILRAEPSQTPLGREGVPRQLRRILRTCLAKDPTRRFQNVLDLRNTLETMRDELDDEDQPTPRLRGGPASPTRALAWMIAGSLIGMATAYLFFPAATSEYPTDAPPASRPMVPLVATEGILPETPDVDLRGERMVYAAEVRGQQDLWQLETAGGTPKRLTDDPAVERHPAYSPDGRKVAFSVSGGGAPGIHVMAAEGATPERIVDFGTNPSWAPTGEQIVFEWSGGIWVSDIAIGAAPRPVAANIGTGSHPMWGPGGDVLLAYSESANDVVRIHLDGTPPENLALVPAGNQVTSLALTDDGRDLYLSMGQYGGNKSVWHVPMEPVTGQVAGAPLMLTREITDDRDVAVAGDGSRIVFLARKVARDLYSLALDPDTGVAAGVAERLTASAPQNYYPSFAEQGQTLLWTAQTMGAGLLFSKGLGSETQEHKLTPEWDRMIRETGGSYAPDGQRLVYSSTTGGVYRLWRILDGSGNPRRFAHTLEDQDQTFGDYLPAWSPDGRWIAFYSNRSGGEDIWVADAEQGSPQRVTTLAGIEQLPAWSPDSRSIVFRSQQDTDADLWIVGADGSNPRVIVDTEADEAWAAWSPAGDRLYFASDLSGRYEIWACDTDGIEACIDQADLTRVTTHLTPRRGLPDNYFFTKFGVLEDRLIVPIEVRSGELWSLELPGRTR